MPGHDSIRGSLNLDSYQVLLLDGYLDLYSSNGMADRRGSYCCRDSACRHRGRICPQTGGRRKSALLQAGAGIRGRKGRLINLGGENGLLPATDCAMGARQGIDDADC